MFLSRFGIVDMRELDAKMYVVLGMRSGTGALPCEPFLLFFLKLVGNPMHFLIQEMGSG